MNSISYLDSVLSRSFVTASDRPTSRPSSSSKRSSSHSSLPGSRRASRTSPPTPSGSSSLRRWSQEQNDPAHSIYNNPLRRTGSTPAGIYPSQALDTDDSDSDQSSTRGARWSALWGLTGWLDDAIHPGSRHRSRKNSDSEVSSLLRTKRMPSLDDLLLSSTAPRRDAARRTASSGSGRISSRHRHEISNGTDISQSEPRRRSKRYPRFGQAAALTLTAAENQDEADDTWSGQDESTHRHQDPDLMTEKEREDIVEFDGGDFAPEEIERPRERTISQSSAESSWGDGSSLSHEATAPLASAPDSESVAEGKQEDHDTAFLQDQHDERSVDSETLLDAAKGEPEAIEVVAHEDPTSTVVDPAAASTTPKKGPTKASRDELGAPADADETPTSNRKGLKRSEPPASASNTPSASRRASLRRKRDASSALGPVASSSTSSLTSTDSEQAVDRSLTPSKARRRRSVRASATSSTKTSETEESRGWVAPRKGNLNNSGETVTTSKNVLPHRRRISSTKRAIRRTLLTLRDLLLAVLLCPVNCVRYLCRRRAMHAEEAIEAVYERAQVSILEKNATSYNEASPQQDRSPSLHITIKADLRRDMAEERNNSAGRPHTPKPDEKDVSSKSSSFSESEPITEDQAAELGTVWKAMASGQRTPSRLLPNPQMVDPMLAHNSKVDLIDVVMAEKEAVMEAERQSRIAKGRAARRAAANGNASDSRSSPPPSTLLPTKIPRGPTSSVIHHSPKILVLDLDETLIHSTSRSPSHYASSGGRTTTSGFLGLETAGAFLGLRANDNPRRIRPHMVEVVLDGRSVLYHVYKRPWTDYFLRKVASWYTVVIFTASVQEYADPVIDWLDQGRGLISHRLFRESCSFKGGSYVKNLAVVDQDLSKVCLVDNSPASYRLNRANGIPIEGWTHDPNDEALLDLLPVLDSLRFASDVRHILGIRGW